MMSEMKNCIEFKITSQEKVYIELQAPYVDILKKMFPSKLSFFRYNSL